MLRYTRMRAALRFSRTPRLSLKESNGDKRYRSITMVVVAEEINAVLREIFSKKSS